MTASPSNPPGHLRRLSVGHVGVDALVLTVECAWVQLMRVYGPSKVQCRVVFIQPAEMPEYELAFENGEQLSSLRLLITAGKVPVPGPGPVFPAWRGLTLPLVAHVFQWGKQPPVKKWVAAHPDDYAHACLSWWRLADTSTSTTGATE
jgi:hypothetical protein